MSGLLGSLNRQVGFRESGADMGRVAVAARLALIYTIAFWFHILTIVQSLCNGLI
jgi:molybdopterin/thiamine biosynthesis adenylyltransferase